MKEYYLPRSGDDMELAQIAIYRPPTYTHRLDLEKERIRGMADGIEAMKQAVYLRLLIPLCRYPIYSASYGSELQSLVGQHIHYAMSEAKRMIGETLLYDDRILGVSDFYFDRDKGMLKAYFKVKTIFGEFESEASIPI